MFFRYEGFNRFLVLMVVVLGVCTPEGEEFALLILTSMNILGDLLMFHLLLLSLLSVPLWVYLDTLACILVANIPRPIIARPYCLLLQALLMRSTLLAYMLLYIT